MTRAPRLTLYSLLVLMQIIAPWVHAHTGAETGGFLHLPGLERLAGGGKGWTPLNPSGDTGLIVSVQAGVWHDAEAAQFVPDSPEQPAPPAAFPAPLPLAAVSLPPEARGSPPPFRFIHRVTQPRAPPLPASGL